MYLLFVLWLLSNVHLGPIQSACASTFTEFYSGLFYEPITIGDIQWNFEKFLIGKDGKPFSRYHPSVQDPEALKDDINTLLNA